MKQQISVEEISRLEEKCRRIRSEAIYNSFASLFRGFGTTLLSLSPRGRTTHGRLEGGGVIGAQTR